MVHVCAGIHFYHGTCWRWRIWYKPPPPRYRQLSISHALTSVNWPFGRLR